MRPRLAPALSVLVGLLLLSGCSTIDSLNPFVSKGPKMAELTPFKASVETRAVWRENVGKSDVYAFTPAIVGNAVYAASRDGTIARFEDGKRVWRIDAGQPLSGGVGADARLLVVGTPKGEVIAFDPADGKRVWSARASSEVLAPPAVGGGLVVVRSGDNRLIAYDALDGKRKWTFQRPMPALALRATAAPLIDNNVVVSGFPGGKVIAVNAGNGVQLWEGTVALPKGSTELDRVSDVTSQPVVAGRLLCAVAFQGKVACFDISSGNTLWSRDMSSAVGLTLEGRHLYVTDDKGAVYALDIASGASIWKQDKLLNRGVGAPVARRNLLAVADVQGYVHFLNRDDGAFVGRLSTDGTPVVAPLQLLDNRVLVQTSGGSVLAIEAQ